MKKFIWPYQRLLEVKDKQEQALRGELISLTEKAAGVRGRIMMLNMMLRSLLDALRNPDAEADRIKKQAEFMQNVHVKDAQIQQLEIELNEIEEKRKEKIQELMTLQKFRKSLQQLRTKAMDEYHTQVNRYEQNMLDDNTNAAYARAILKSS